MRITANGSIQITPDTGLIEVELPHAHILGHADVVIDDQHIEADSFSLTSHRERVTLHGRAEELRFANPDGILLEALVYAEQPFISLRCGFRNEAAHTRMAQGLSPLSSDALRFGSVVLDGWVNGFHSWCYTGYIPHTQRQPVPRFRRMTGGLYYGWNPTTPFPRRRAMYTGEGVAALIAPGGSALVAGFITLRDQFGQVYLSGRAPSLRLETSTDGVPIEPGRELWGERAILYTITLPHADPLGAYAEAAARETSPRHPTPLPGWCSWYQFFDQVSSEDMRRNQQILFDGRRTLPLPRVQLDDGYQAAWGDWLETNERFPNGIEAWAGTVRSLDLHPGIWMAPFTVKPDSQWATSHPTALFVDEQGQPIDVGHTGRTLWGLDPTHPAVRDYLREVVERFTGWGIDYLKLDFLYCGALPSPRYDPTQTRAQALRTGLELIRDVAGDDVTLLGCGCPLGPALGLVDLMRVGPDVAPRWYNDPPTARALQPTNYHIPSTRNALHVTLNRQWAHRRWWWNDGDTLLAREAQQMTLEEVRTLITVLGLTGSHIMLSDDTAQLSEERQRMASLLLPVRGIGMLDTGLFQGKEPDTLVLRREHAPQVLAALINWENDTVERVLDPAAMGLHPPVTAVELWQRTARVLRAPQRVLIPKHGVRLFALHPIRAGKPHVAGSNLHIGMGSETTEWNFDGERLTFTVDLGKHIEGTLWLYLPRQPIETRMNGALSLALASGREGLFALPARVRMRAPFEVTLT